MVHMYNFSTYEADVGRAPEVWGAGLFYTINPSQSCTEECDPVSKHNQSKQSNNNKKDFIKFKNISLPET